MSFQEKLRYYREKAGYKSAKEFASLLGVPYTTYISYENKNREPRYNTLKKISRLLGVSIDVLLENISSEADQVIQDLRLCGFTVTANTTAKKLKEPAYDIEWGENRTFWENGQKYDWREFGIVLEQKELLEVYATVNSSLAEMISAISHLKSNLYENNLNQIQNERYKTAQIMLFKYPGFREMIRNKNPELYKKLEAESKK